MATYTDNFSSGWAQLIVTISESGVRVANNTSVISWAIKIKKLKSSSSHNSGGADIRLTVGGTRRYTADSFSISSLGVGSTKTLKSGSYTKTHSSDGSLNVGVSAGFNSGVGLGNASISKTFKATTIPRASSPTCANSVNIGSSITISTNRASSSFTHTLTWAFAGKTGTIATGVGSSNTWAVPASMASNIPNATSGTATITCKTYSGSTLIGTKTTTTKLNVPTSSGYRPTLSGVAISEGNTQVTANFGERYVQGLSVLVGAVTASGAYGSTIKAYENTIEGVKYNARTFASSAVRGSGEITISSKVTDSRGRTATKSTNVTIVPYTAPLITNLEVVQTNENGEPDNEGAYSKVTIGGTYSPVEGQNTQTLTLKYKKASDSTYTSIDIPVSGENWTVSQIIGGIIPDVTYDYVAELQDKIRKTSQSIKSGVITISRLAGGKGITLFKEATKEGFFVGDVDYTISTDDFNEISSNVGGIPDMSLGSALKKMTEAVDVTLTWKSGWGGTYTCKAYPAQRICRLTGTVATGHPVLEPSTYVTVADIPSAYLPQEVYTLTASGGTQFVEGAVSSLGVRLRAKIGNWTAGYVGYFSGWWYY